MSNSATPKISNKLNDKYNFVIIQGYWPEPESIFTDAKYRHSIKHTNPHVFKSRSINACRKINEILRQKYLTSSKLFFVGNIDWITTNLDQCFNYSNVHTFPIDYNTLAYQNEIESTIGIKCGTKFSQSLADTLLQRLDRIWLNKFNIMYQTAVYVQSQKSNVKERFHLDWNKDKTIIVWLDIGLKQWDLEAIQDWFDNIIIKYDSQETRNDNIKYENINANAQTKIGWYFENKFKDSILALAYDKEMLDVQAKKFGWYLNDKCDTKPIFVASCFMTHIQTLYTFIDSFNQTFHQMVSDIRDKNDKQDLVCDCFDEEIVIANTITEKMNKSKWRWSPIGYT